MLLYKHDLSSGIPTATRKAFECVYFSKPLVPSMTNKRFILNKRRQFLNIAYYYKVA